MPNASARFEISSIGMCCFAGVDSAQWLFSQTNTAGTFHSCARLSDSWNVPMFVAPSPKNATATRGSSRNWNASAAPTLAGAEALLHLLLEAPNQQHLAEELAHLRVRQRALFLDLRHERQSRALML